jgi:hypothetical protein
MPDRKQRCARCHTDLVLAQFGAYEDGAIVKVFACRFCDYLKVETENPVDRCDHRWIDHLM